MNQKEYYLEENMARLIRAASGPDTRPGVHASAQTFQLLLTYVQARSSTVAFPDAAVGGVGATLVLVAIWLIVQTAIIDMPLIAYPPLIIMATGLILNLALIPVAGIVILIRRQHG